MHLARTRQPVVIAALALCVGAAPAGFQLAWIPVEGDVLERRLELALEVEFRSAGFEVLGQTLELDDLEADFDPTAAERSLDIEAVASDHLVAVDGARALVVERTFETVEVDGRVDEDGPETVRFVWDRRRGRYTTQVLDPDVEPDEAEVVARILREDVDCRWLLPGAEVETDSTWELELTAQQALELVGIPGLEVAEVFRIGMEADELAEPALVRAFEPVLDKLDDVRRAGHVSAELVGTRVVDGATIATVELSLEVELHLDISDFMRTAVELEAHTDAENLPKHIRALILVSGEGEGTFEWNVTAGRLHALETAVDYVFEINGGFEMAMEGKTLPFSGWASWGGELVSRRTATER